MKNKKQTYLNQLAKQHNFLSRLIVWLFKKDKQEKKDGQFN